MDFKFKKIPILTGIMVVLVFIAGYNIGELKKINTTKSYETILYNNQAVQNVIFFDNSFLKDEEFNLTTQIVGKKTIEKDEGYYTTFFLNTYNNDIENLSCNYTIRSNTNHNNIFVENSFKVVTKSNATNISSCEVYTQNKESNIKIFQKCGITK